MRALTASMTALALALAGCQPKPGGAAPTRLTLTADAVGGVPLGGPAAAMEAEVTALFGAPTEVADREPCELAGPAAGKERAYTWQNLTVTAVAEKVARWDVRPGELSARLDLPYGVGTTTTVPDALTRIPGATGRYDEVFGFFEITTEAEPELFWTGARQDGSGPITHVWSHPVFCE